MADAPYHWWFLVRRGVGSSFKRGLDHRRLTWCLWTTTVAEEGIEACCLITRLSRLRILQELMFSHKRYKWNITSMSFLLSFSWDLCCGTFLINARVFRFYRVARLQRHRYRWVILQPIAVDSFLLRRKGDPAVLLFPSRTCPDFIATILDKSPWDSTVIFIFFCYFSVLS